jgi:hypothetical protein
MHVKKHHSLQYAKTTAKFAVIYAIEPLEAMCMHTLKGKALGPNLTTSNRGGFLKHGAYAGMIGFITLQQSAPFQRTWQDNNASRKH